MQRSERLSRLRTRGDFLRVEGVLLVTRQAGPRRHRIHHEPHEPLILRDELVAMGIVLMDGKDPATGELMTSWEVKR